MERKTIVRVVCLALVAIMLLTMFTGVIGSLFAGASSPSNDVDVAPSPPSAAPSAIATFADEGGSSPSSGPVPARAGITGYQFYEKKVAVTTLKAGVVYGLNIELDINTEDYNDSVNLNCYFDVSGSIVKIASSSVNIVKGNTEKNLLHITIQFSDIRYTGGSQRIELTLNQPGSPPTPISTFYFSLSATSPGGVSPDKNGTSGSTDDPDKTADVKALPLIDSIFVEDKAGKRLDEVDKDTAPFVLRVTYRDYGLEKVDYDQLKDGSMSVYIKDSGGFTTADGVLAGNIKWLNQSRSGVPRFQILFSGLSFDEKESNQLSLSVVYQVEDVYYTTDLTVKVTQAKTKKEDEDKEKISPLTPYIIVNHTFGTEDIVAGKPFTLTLNATNTSKEIPLENIVLNITTPEELSIVSASNMIHIPQLGAGASTTHSIDMMARSNAEVGSANIELEFKYQYIDAINEKREEKTTPLKISVPITQVDRFEVSPITEMSDYIQINEPFFVTVSFVNRGKSKTYGISAKAVNKAGETLASEYHGNLDAGKSDSIELSITSEKEGEMMGEVVVVYEDENNNDKEVRRPFTANIMDMSNEMGWGDGMDPSMMGEKEEDKPKTDTSTLIMSIAGALFLAAPLGYVIIKQNKAKDGEFMDEDF